MIVDSAKTNISLRGLSSHRSRSTKNAITRCDVKVSIWKKFIIIHVFKIPTSDKNDQKRKRKRKG